MREILIQEGVRTDLGRYLFEPKSICIYPDEVTPIFYGLPPRRHFLGHAVDMERDKDGVISMDLHFMDPHFGGEGGEKLLKECDITFYGNNIEWVDKEDKHVYRIFIREVLVVPVGSWPSGFPRSE